MAKSDAVFVNGESILPQARTTWVVYWDYVSGESGNIAVMYVTSLYPTPSELMQLLNGAHNRNTVLNSIW